MNPRETNPLPPGIPNNSNFTGNTRQNMVNHNYSFNPQQRQVVNGGWNRENSSAGGINYQKGQIPIPRNNIVPGPNLDNRNTTNRFRINNQPNPQNPGGINGGFDTNRFVQQPVSEPTDKKEIKSNHEEEKPKNSIAKTFFKSLKRQNLNTDNSYDSLETVISKVNTDRPGELSKAEKFFVGKLPINQNE
jgi:hypothetical protein